jgi:hypothetical protein
VDKHLAPLGNIDTIREPMEQLHVSNVAITEALERGFV